ncbi:hypothetical protein O3P69_004704 [Scylla paramamosain]|uniref:Scygonadin n=4 Tax=Scylla TaxID=6760 RepID=SCYG_SCYSE|nr:RecName: Full=Scygonadin; Flags: Precursor [Scylla serrata]AAW57403.1 scygonadin precursor [Scylla serrata]AAY98913.1 scygonadin precursor [Scylla serrata]
MRSSLLLGLTVVVLLGVIVPPCMAGQALNKLMPKIVSAIIYMVGQPNAGVTFLGHQCLVESTRQPDGFYTAKMSCASWTHDNPIVGEGRSRVELEALKGSITNFVQTASNYKKFTIDEVEDWIASY